MNITKREQQCKLHWHPYNMNINIAANMNTHICVFYCNHNATYRLTTMLHCKLRSSIGQSLRSCYTLQG